MRVYIDYGQGPVDYTRYVVDASLSIEDSVNVPSLVNFMLVATDQTFVIPKRSSYVKIVSEIYAQAGGKLAAGQDPFALGKILATGFISNELEREYLGLNGKLGYNTTHFQQLSYRVNVTSDEWLLNTRFVPFIPAFINQTQGQILANIAEALAPGFFDVTSFVASGDLIPFYEYDPQQTWSDVAKTFADSSRYRVKCVNKVIYYEPFGSRPLGIKYDEATQNQRQFDPTSLTTNVLTVPPVNDALVLGQEEPQDQWDNYLIGDGFTSNFQLLYSSFRGSSVTLQSDDWTETAFDNAQWNVQDPLNTFALVGALNVNQVGNPSPQLGVTYVVGRNGVEIGGALNVQAGEFEFVDTCDGIVGGLYTSSSLLASACFAGFQVSASSSIVLTSSGAGGIIIQPMLFGVPVGPTVVTKPNHHYQLQIWIGGNQFSRYNSIYRNLDGSTQYGGNALASYGQVTFVIGDIDIGIVVANQYGPQSLGPPVPVVPQLTKYTATALNMPEFGIFAPVNGKNLNLAVNYSLISQPPQGTLNVQSLSGVSGGLLPILPQNLSQYQHYLLGSGFENQTATITQAGDVDQLAFYNDTIPGVGSRIRFTSWESGVALARVNNPAAIANEAAIAGDSGVRSAIFTNLTPQPRTSDECELAAAAAIVDRSFPQFQGAYQVFSIPYYFEDMYDPDTADYPQSGRNFFINSPVRAVSGSNFFVNTVRLQVVELREEILQVQIDYGPDLYLEKLLQNFVQRSDKLLTPKETQKAPTPVQLANAGAFFLPPFQNPQVVSIVNTVSGSFVTVDLGAAPVTAAEVRRIDGGWGTHDSNFVGLFTTQRFTLLRTAHDQHWFIRPVNGGQTSRFSYTPRINMPLIPGQPFPVSLDISNGLTPVVTFDYPQQGVLPNAAFSQAGYIVDSQNPFVSDVYGLEIRGPDNATILLQRVVTAPSDLVVTLTSISGLIVSGALSLTGGFLTIYPYFFNLMWDYSAPYGLTFDPALGGCCADCVNPMDYGAVGDGITDDTIPVQKALDIAAFNAGATGLFPMGIPATAAGVFRTGTVVCIPSGHRFLVTPQALDFTSPSSSGFGPLAYCVTIGSGVKMQLEGELLLGQPDVTSPLYTYPWVIMTNRNQYVGGDSGIVIDGAGSFNANGPFQANQNVSIRQIQISSVHQTAVRVCGSFGYAVDNTTQQICKIDMSTGLVVKRSAPLSGFFVQGGIAVLTQIECDNWGNIYIGLGGSGDFGLIVCLDAGSMQIVSSQGYSGFCGGITAGIPKYCDNCQSVHPPCIGNPGDLVIVPVKGPSPVTQYIAAIDRINIPGWNDVPVMTQYKLDLTTTMGCPGAFVNNKWGTGVFYYGGASLSNPHIPAGSADIYGNIYVFNPNGATPLLTVGRFQDGVGAGSCGCCGGFLKQLTTPFLNTVLSFDLSGQGVIAGNPYIGYSNFDKTTLLATSGSKTLFKLDPTAGYTITDSLDLTAYNPFFDKHSFKSIDGTTGLMIVRAFDSFLLIDTASMTVANVYSNIQTLTGGQINVSQQGETSYDPNTGTIIFNFSGKAFQIGLGSGAFASTFGCLKLQGCTETQIKNVQFKQYTSFGFYGSSCQGVEVRGVRSPRLFAQQGFTVLFDMCTNMLVDSCLVDATSSTAGLSFVTDYVGQGLVVSNNIVYGIRGYGVRHESYGLEDDVDNSLPAYAAIDVTNNLFSSGFGAGASMINMAPVGVETGFTISNNMITGCQQVGITIGNIANAVLIGNTIVNGTGGMVKGGAQILTNVTIKNNIVSGNSAYNIPDISVPTNPAYVDGSSTVVMYNPSVDTSMFKSFTEQQPTIEGTVSGKAGYVFPPQPPNSMYAVGITGLVNGSPITQNGSAASYFVGPFYIEWTDKIVQYDGITDNLGNLVAQTPPHGYATYYVFVDDPFRNGDSTQIKYGATTLLSDLASSAGRYFLGAIILSPAGGGTGTLGGFLPGAMTLPVSQPYDIGCTFDGTIPPSWVLTRLPMVRTVTFLANLPPSQGKMNIVPTSTWTASIQKNGTQFGTMTFAAGASVATFSSTQTTLNQGDVLTVVAPSAADVTASDIGYIISGLRNFVDTPVLSLFLSDSLNFWNDAVVTNFPSLKLQLSDTLNNWADVFSGTLNQTSLNLSDSLNFWQDNMSRTFPALSLSLSDNLNNWADIMVGNLI